MTKAIAIQHSARAHSSVGGSSAKRVMECPGSMQLCAKYPSKSSEFADEGTAGDKGEDQGDAAACREGLSAASSMRCEVQ